MGKVPSRVKFDEDGFPIPQTMQADTVQFDEDGLPIPVKKKATGTDLSMVGGKAVPSGGQVGIFKAPLSEVKKKPQIDVESYNKNFESVSGHKEIDLGSQLPQVKKAKEQSKYLKYRDVEENQIKPLQAAISMGTVTPSQLAKSYNNPLSKNIVSGIVKEQLPDANIQGLSEDVFGNEKKWDLISKEINLKNIEPFTLVLFQNQALFQLRWNGMEKETLELDIHKNHVWSSSTLYPEEIRKQRADWFYTFLEANPVISKTKMLSFHRYTEKENQQNGLVINRNEQMKTLSITQSVIKKNKGTILHYDLIAEQEFTTSFITV